MESKRRAPRWQKCGDIVLGLLYAAAALAFFTWGFYVCGATPPGAP